MMFRKPDLPEPEPLTRSLLGHADRAPLGHLGVQPWLSWPETQAVIAALKADGAEVRFVGGCVRDALAHRPVHDIDLATPTPPEQVMALLERAGLRVVPTGLSHGTVTAVCGSGRSFEITTLRQDVATDGRHAEVAWTTNWMADAARRDFTINALSATPDGAVYDYFDGIEHLAHGRVIFVGRAALRIQEDALRILRFFRFHARYGRGGPSAAALSACRLHAADLQALSAERIRDELLKILTVPEPTATLLEMRGVRVLEQILPEAKAFGVLRQVAFLEERGIRIDGLSPCPLRRLAALTGETAEILTVIGHRLRLSGAEIRRLAAMGRDLPVPESGGTRAALVRWGREACLDRVLLGWARHRDVEGRTDSTGTARRMALLTDLAVLPVPDLPVAGRDVVAAGVPPGPEVGRVLERLRQWWLDQDCDADRAQLLQVLPSAIAAEQGGDGAAARP
ncbi:CCA tRNA nucleotidyltransferase [Novispirillum itersonii]|uniref:Poly(A) polymerase n=1 Tax=Novispirillum itersonii TaxID=189 RepID=A0A7X0DKI7_NOVIT|nr:CCA tRNA nucleotidyltransferase [Novispirillum itersonii]MBB6208995.1 poly(A) polymerase [Novispirillum itersonii]